MKTKLRILMLASLVAVPFGVAKADPTMRGLIQIQDRPHYEEPSVQIWTDRDWYAIGDEVRVTVTVDRPSFVTVYNIDAQGYVRRLTEDPRGVRVTPGRPLALPRRARTRLVTTGPGGVEELVAVASPIKFVACDLPFYGDGSQRGLFVPVRDRDSYVRHVNARLVEQRECAPQSTSRVTFWVEPIRHRAYPIRISGGFFIDIGFEIPLGAQVYVDGSYCGRGPSALSRHVSGRHKVTVHTDGGRKFTRTVDFDSARRFRSDVQVDGASRGNTSTKVRSKKR